MLKTALIIFSIVCTLTLSAQVIDYAIDPSFNSGFLYNKGAILDILVDTEDILISSNGMNSNSPAMGLSLIDSDGAFIQTLYTASNLGPTNLEFYKNRYIYYGGRIVWFDINMNNQGLYFEYMKQEYSGFLTDKALDVLILPEDLILVAGRYFTDTSTSVESLRHLCLIDSTGSPVAGFPMVHCAQPIDAEIYTIDSLSDGSYIIAGRFSEVNGHPCNNIARLNPDFSVDTEFENSLVFRSYARVKLIDSQDRIWLSLGFGGLISDPNDSIFTVRLLPSGEVDLSFQVPIMMMDLVNVDPQGQQLQVGFSGLYEDMDDTFIITGGLTSYNGVDVKGILKIFDNGLMVEGAFSGLGADEAVWENWNASSFGPAIGSIVSVENDKILLGGKFSSFGGESYSCLVRLQPNGTVGTKDIAPPLTKVKVYPNPTDQYVTIEYSLLKSMEETTIAIYDATGRLLEQRPLGNNYKGQVLLDTRKIPNGIYFYELLQDGSKLKGGKFIIQH